MARGQGQHKRQISPAGVDIRTGAQAMSPAAARLAIQARGKKGGPLELTGAEIAMRERQVENQGKKAGVKETLRRSRERIEKFQEGS